MGVDPGTQITGYGLIRQTGGELSLMICGVIKMGKLQDTHPAKLGKIFKRLLQLVETYKPDEMAVEAPFFGKNVQSMLKLGRVQGVAMAAALQRDVPVTEYAPRKIKKAVTGNGNASKMQIAGLLPQLLPELKREATPEFLDATDALATAVCHAFQQFPQTGGKSSRRKNYSSWEAFLKENPERRGS